MFRFWQRNTYVIGERAFTERVSERSERTSEGTERVSERSERTSEGTERVSTGPVLEDRSTDLVGLAPSEPLTGRAALKAAQTFSTDRFGAVGYQLPGTARKRSQRETRAALTAAHR